MRNLKDSLSVKDWPQIMEHAEKCARNLKVYAADQCLSLGHFNWYFQEQFVFELTQSL